MPTEAAKSVRITDSVMIMENTRLLLIPIARSIPNSRSLSKMDMSMVFKIPNARASMITTMI